MTTKPQALTVLHVDSEVTWRGGEAQVIYLCKGLIQRGHTPIVCGVGHGALLTTAVREGVRVQALDGFATSPRRLRPLSFKTVWALRHAIRGANPDIVHAHTPNAHSLSLLALLGLSTPLVVSRRVDFRISKGLFGRWKYGSRVSAFIAISKRVRRVLIGGGAPAGKIKLVHSGINTSRFKGVSPDRTLRAQFGFPSDCLLVGNIAKLAGYKDHPTLLRAAKVVCDKLPNARFLIVGEGEEKRKLESLKNELGLEGKLVFAGFRKDVPRILATLDLFVMSSHMEGLGTTVLDAMAASLPVVATHAGGIPEAVKDGKTGILVPKRQPERLAEGIISLLRDPDLRKKMGQAGAQRVDRKFSAEAMVEGNLRVYREVCNIQPAPNETERGAHS